MNGPIDAELLGQLLDEHGPALALYATQWTTTADDCVQEALVELARQPERPEHLVAWLYRVVKNRALNAARAARRRREREARAADARQLFARPSTALDRYDALAVGEALERLDAEEREVVVMRIWGGLTYEELADSLSISTSTAHRRYEQALSQLRKILESPCASNTNQTNKNLPPN